MYGSLLKFTCRKIVPIIAFVLTLSGCQVNRGVSVKTYLNENGNKNLESLEIRRGALHFFIIGDWGRNGHFRQKEVADIMHQAGFIIEPEFIISTGDNFYPDGVASKFDPYLKSSFEDVYSGYNLFCPWFLTLGNHDYRGSVQAQIDYTLISRRWNLPARYFELEKPYGKEGEKIQFLFADTTPFYDPYYSRAGYESVKEQDSLAQKNWIDNKLSESSATWKIVIGHHPFYTSGRRKNRKSFVKDHLEPLFEKHKVDLYFAGHEHDLQHLKPKDVTTHHFISGAGSEVRASSYGIHSKFADSGPGFIIASALDKVILLQFVNWKGEVIYSTEILKD